MSKKVEQVKGGNYYEAEDIRDAARGNWEGILTQLGIRADVLGGNHSPCPGCGGRDRFRFDDKNGEGTFICSQGSGDLLAGDGIGLVQHALDCSWPQAIEKLGDALIPEKGRSWGKAGAKQKRGSVGFKAPSIDPKTEKAMAFDLDALKAVQRPDWHITEAWLAENSPGDIASITSPADFLNAIFEPDEKILLFTSFYSQGELLHWVDHGTYALGNCPDVKAQEQDSRNPIPLNNPEGCWFLSQPIDGQWRPNPRSKAKEGQVRLSRRSQESVTDWRHTVLENDDAPADLWLNFLAQLPLPIAAIYTSGARSIHALLRMPVASKESWDRMRKVILPLFSKLGADPGSLTAVRLTRLPGVQRLIVRCLKCQRVKTSPQKSFKCKCGAWVKPGTATWEEQKLLYFNPSPDPEAEPIGMGVATIQK